MSEDFWLWAWGAVGALIFAGPVFAMKVYADPAGDAAADHRRRALAAVLAVLAVLTGAASAQAFASVAQDWAAHLVKLPRTAAALIVGVSANFLWPKILRRLGQEVDKPKPTSAPPIALCPGELRAAVPPEPQLTADADLPAATTPKAAAAVASASAWLTAHSQWGRDGWLRVQLAKDWCDGKR